MADERISALPAVATPAAADEFAVNQAGTSKKETRAQIHALESGEHLVLPQVDEAATPTLAFGNGDTGITEEAAENLAVSIGGTYRWRLNASAFTSATTSGASVGRGAATATAPAFFFLGDSDTGIGRSAADQLSLIAGGKEMLQLKETGVATTDQLIIGPAGVIGSAATPSLAFGDGDTGFYESADDTLRLSLAGIARLLFNTGGISSLTGSGPFFLNEAASATNPTLVPNKDDPDTGLGWNSADVGALIAGGVNVMQFGEAAAAPLMGFFGTAAIAKPSGIAVTAAGIHAALVSLGLIAA